MTLAVAILPGPSLALPAGQIGLPTDAEPLGERTTAPAAKKPSEALSKLNPLGAVPKLQTLFGVGPTLDTEAAPGSSMECGRCKKCLVVEIEEGETHCDSINTPEACASFPEEGEATKWCGPKKLPEDLPPSLSCEKCVGCADVFRGTFYCLVGPRTAGAAKCAAHGKSQGRPTLWCPNTEISAADRIAGGGGACPSKMECRASSGKCINAAPYKVEDGICGAKRCPSKKCLAPTGQCLDAARYKVEDGMCKKKR
jgi:hypothetical protein